MGPEGFCCALSISFLLTFGVQSRKIIQNASSWPHMLTRSTFSSTKHNSLMKIADYQSQDLDCRFPSRVVGMSEKGAQLYLSAVNSHIGCLCPSLSGPTSSILATSLFWPYLSRWILRRTVWNTTCKYWHNFVPIWPIVTPVHCVCNFESTSLVVWTKIKPMRSRNVSAFGGNVRALSVVADCEN